MKAATCTEDGAEERTCACGEKETRSIPATGHTPVIAPAVRETCTTDGLTEGKHCSKCGTVFVRQNVIPATGHTFGGWVTVREATCTKQGVEERTCACGEKQSRTVPLKSHDFSDGVCTICGTRISRGLLFVKNPDGNSYSVSGIGSCTDTEIVIPSVYEGKPVTGIAPGAFMNCDGITGVVIPEGVTVIGKRAFFFCTALAGITLPESMTEIGALAFAACESLTEVTLPAGMKSIEAELFSGCISLLSVSIPDTVTSIGANAFADCRKLTSIALPDSLTAIDSYAFYQCQALAGIFIPESVSELGTDFISGCPNLSSITVSSRNRVFHAAGNCLIKTADRALVAGCRNSVIPDDGSVTKISDNAFRGCTGLTSIRIPESITEIGESAFSDCTALTAITIPGSVKKIVSRVFSSCSALKDVTIGNGVTWIERDAFRGCTGLYSLEIPENVTRIDCGAFRGCKNLESITISFVGATKDGDENTHFGYIFGAESAEDNAKYVPTWLRTVVITGGTRIEENAFAKCTNLTDVTLPEGLTKIGYRAFSDTEFFRNRLYRVDGVLYCGNYLITADGVKGEYTIRTGTVLIADNAFSDSALAGVIFPDSMKYIGNSAFYSCGDLTGVTLPDGLLSIGDEAFSCCGGLTSLIVPDSVVYIGKEAFSGNGGLADITIPDGIPYIGTNAFMHTAYYKNQKNWEGGILYLGTYLLDAIQSVSGEIVVRDGTRLIAGGAFSGCKKLTGVTLPVGVYGIGDEAFANCMALERINIPEGVTSIGEGAFRYCTALADVVLPKSLTKIGAEAFRNCGGISEIVIPNGVTRIAARAFYQSGLETVTLPEGLTGIGAEAFYNTAIAEIRIGNRVAHIGKGAFYNCSCLIVTYDGTKEQWLELCPERDDIANQYTGWQTPGGFVVHCTDGDI